MIIKLILILMLFLSSCMNDKEIVELNIDKNNTEIIKEELIKPDNDISEIEMEIKSLDDINQIIYFDCEWKLYEDFTPDFTLKNIDNESIQKCRELKKEYEIKYYKEYIKKVPKIEISIKEDFTKEYNEYKETILTYEQYIEDIESYKMNIDNVNNTSEMWNNYEIPSILTEDEYLKWPWFIESYEEFKTKKIENLKQQRQDMIKKQFEYKKRLLDLE